MEVQQKLNWINRILKQTVGLQHINFFVWKILSLVSRGSNKFIFQIFGDTRYDNIALKQRSEKNLRGLTA